MSGLKGFGLFVDYREAYIIAELDKKGVKYQTDNLDIGDYQIRLDEKIVGIWERKTYADLAASVSDNRYREQKHRLTTSDARWKGYIIEGLCPAPTRNYHSLRPGALDSIKIGLTCRDGFNVLYSSGLSHTVIILEKLLKKLPEYLKEDRGTEALVDKYHSALVQSTVSSVKKENLTAETCYLAQLAQIPKMSFNSAKVIHARWSNMGSLTTAISLDRSGTKGQLSELRVNGRRLGDVLAQRICDFLVPEPKKVVIKKRT